MDYTISIPDELTPGIVAIAYAENKTPEQVVSEYAINIADNVCRDLVVGPYWFMPQPRFNADGTPYVAPTEDPAPVEDPGAGE